MHSLYPDVKSVGTIEDDFYYDMHVTYCDWENDDNATYDLENLFGINSENDDMEGLELGDDGIENPLAISDMIIDNSFSSKNTFLHVDHDENALCDSYIVEFIHDATKNYYERGTHAYRYLNFIKISLSMLKVSKLHLFCLPMLISLCFNESFLYKIPLHRKWGRLKRGCHFLS